MTDVLRAPASRPSRSPAAPPPGSRSGRPVEGGSLMTDLTVVVIDTPTLGDRSYLVHDGEVAFVVDPQRDIDRVLALLDEHGVRLTHVFETHIHNDYVTGGLALASAPARRTSSTPTTRSPSTAPRSRTARPSRSGGRMRVTALATPGHTFTHLSYALDRRGDGRPSSVGVFSGGSLLYGATGRPDLLGAEHTHALVRHQHASAHRLADLLPDEAEVFPTHGFGSFCSATQSDATDVDHRPREAGQPGAHAGRGDLRPRAARRARRLAGLLRAHGAGQHRRPGRAGPEPPGRRRRRRAAPPHRGRRVGRRPAQPHRLRRRPRSRHPELRPRRRVRDLPRLADPLGHPADPARRDRRGGRRGPARAGPDRHRPARGARHRRARRTGRTGELASFPTATFADLDQVRHHREVVVLDVRRSDEHAAARIDGAVNIPIHELPAPPRRGAGRRGVGALRRRLPCLRRRLAARRRGAPPVAVDDSFDNAGRGRPAPGAAPRRDASSSRSPRVR